MTVAARRPLHDSPLSAEPVKHRFSAGTHEALVDSDLMEDPDLLGPHGTRHSR
jgi:hypothetical protein